MPAKSQSASQTSTADESHFSFDFWVLTLGYFQKCGVKAMSQTFLQYGLVALALSPMAIGLGWAIWEGHVRPTLIPRATIEALADKVLAESHDDPLDVIEGYECRAWRKSDSFEQGQWRRVWKVVHGRLKAGSDNAN
jgi:hypothetical protein